LTVGLVAAVGLLTLAAPSVAGAAKPSGIWVSNTTPLTTGSSTSCTTPNYSSIQSAIDVDNTGTVIHVCSGTYAEQLQITAMVDIEGVGSPTLQLPATVVNDTTACDSAMEAGGYQANQDLVSICTGDTVSITGLTLNAAWPSGTCYDSLYGVLVGGGATLKLSSSTINAAGAVPVNGCQGGVGVQVGSTRSTPSQVGTAVLSNDFVSGYQKNGMTIDGVGSSATISKTTVTGAGPTDQTAQNGIQVSRGATAKIISSSISGNECDVAVCGADSLADTQATGILFYNAGSGSSVVNSNVNDNDAGLYASGLTNTASSQLSVKGDTFNDDRYESVLLDSDWTTLVNDALSGGNVGLQALQYDGQPFMVRAAARGLDISGMSVAAAQIYSDQVSGDIPVILSISKSQISNNPAGQSVVGSVQDNSSNSSVTLKHNT
jgi:hypothetical protein